MDFTFITDARQCHGVKTPKEYLDRQRHHLLEVARAGVGPGNTPHEASTEEIMNSSKPFISAGDWKMHCGCGNAPSVSLDWDLACCFECGAIYRNLTPPKDRVLIEKILLKRKKKNRHWHLETVEELKQENLDRGDDGI